MDRKGAWCCRKGSAPPVGPRGSQHGDLRGHTSVSENQAGPRAWVGSGGYTGRKELRDRLLPRVTQHSRPRAKSARESQERKRKQTVGFPAHETVYANEARKAATHPLGGSALARVTCIPRCPQRAYQGPPVQLRTQGTGAAPPRDGWTGILGQGHHLKWQGLFEADPPLRWLLPRYQAKAPLPRAAILQPQPKVQDTGSRGWGARGEERGRHGWLQGRVGTGIPEGLEPSRHQQGVLCALYLLQALHVLSKERSCPLLQRREAGLREGKGLAPDHKAWVTGLRLPQHSEHRQPGGDPQKPRAHPQGLVGS